MFPGQGLVRSNVLEASDSTDLCFVGPLFATARLPLLLREHSSLTQWLRLLRRLPPVFT